MLAYIEFAYLNGLSWDFVAAVKIGEGGLEIGNPLIWCSAHLAYLLFAYIIPADWKHRIVFLRLQHALPGCRVFTDLLPLDSRIDREELERELGVLPTDPVEQNRAWYRMYRRKQRDPVVKSSHRTWLLLRDLLGVSLVILPVGIVASSFISGLSPALKYGALGVIVTAALWRSAANAGNRFACNVLAR